MIHKYHSSALYSPLLCINIHIFINPSTNPSLYENLNLVMAIEQMEAVWKFPTRKIPFNQQRAKVSTPNSLIIIIIITAKFFKICDHKFKTRIDLGISARLVHLTLVLIFEIVLISIKLTAVSTQRWIAFAQLLYFTDRVYWAINVTVYIMQTSFNNI